MESVVPWLVSWYSHENVSWLYHVSFIRVPKQWSMFPRPTWWLLERFVQPFNENLSHKMQGCRHKWHWRLPTNCWFALVMSLVNYLHRGRRALLCSTKTTHCKLNREHLIVNLVNTNWDPLYFFASNYVISFITFFSRRKLSCYFI